MAVIKSIATLFHKRPGPGEANGIIMLRATLPVIGDTLDADLTPPINRDEQWRLMHGSINNVSLGASKLCMFRLRHKQLLDIGSNSFIGELGGQALNNGTTCFWKYTGEYIIDNQYRLSFQTASTIATNGQVIYVIAYERFPMQAKKVD
jgi:hypothetical protein